MNGIVRVTKGGNSLTMGFGNHNGGGYGEGNAQILGARGCLTQVMTESSNPFDALPADVREALGCVLEDVAQQNLDT